MRLRDGRFLSLDDLLLARSIAEDNFSPHDARLDGNTLGSALSDAGIELTKPSMEELVHRIMEGPLLTTEELTRLVKGNIDTLFGQKWRILDPDEVVGKMFAFHRLDTVLFNESKDKVLSPLTIEHEASDALGPLLLSTERIRDVVRDERATEKRRSPVLTEAEDDALYARHMTSPLASVQSLEPVLATTEPDRHLDSLCERIDVELLDLSPERLEELDLTLDVNLKPH